MKRLRMPFSVMLPLLELAVWLLLVWVPTTLVYLNLGRTLGRNEQVVMQSGPYSMVLRRDELFSKALLFGTSSGAETIQALNLPAVFVEVPISLPTSWPATWHPRGMLGETWRALSFPIFCLPFWWMVGRGADALRGGRTLRWPLGVAGMLLSLLFAVAFVGVRVAASEQDHFDRWIFWGFGFWTFSFGLLGYAWVRELVVRRRALKAERAIVA